MEVSVNSRTSASEMSLVLTAEVEPMTLKQKWPLDSNVWSSFWMENFSLDIPTEPILTSIPSGELMPKKIE